LLAIQSSLITKSESDFTLCSKKVLSDIMRQAFNERWQQFAADH